MSLLLVDLSNNDARVDFRELRAGGVWGVWLKVTEGTGFLDRTWVDRASRARAAGLHVGGYHFAYPEHGKALGEAGFFARHLGRVQRRDLRPVLDLEVPTDYKAGGPIVAWAHEWLRAVRTMTGVCAMVYSYPDYLERLHLREPLGCGLWLASYGREDGREHGFTVPRPWTKAQAHQFADHARIRGVAGDCDVTHAPSGRPLLAHPLIGGV